MSALTDAIVGFNAKLDTTIDTILGVNSTITSRASAVAANALAAQASEDAARASKEALDVALTTSPNSAALQVNLAAPTGSSLVGFSRASIPSAINTVDWGIYTAAESYNVLRQITPSEWPAVLNGTSTTDLSTSIQAAIDAVYATGMRGAVFFPDGLYNAKGLTLKYGVSLRGSVKVELTESSTVRFGAWLRLTDSANQPLITTDSANGYIRTAASAIGTGPQRYQNSSITRLGFLGNHANQTSFNADIVKMYQNWNITVQDCYFGFSKGFGINGLDCNVISLLNNSFMAAPVYLESPGDSLIQGNQMGGGLGWVPNVLWVSSGNSAAWQNIITSNFLFNNADATAVTATFDAGTDVMTISADQGWQTYTPIMVSTTGTLPGGLSASVTYNVTRLSALTYKLSLSRLLADGSTYVDITSAGTGTHTVGVGLNCSLLLSGALTKWNTISTNRIDQSYGDNVRFVGASLNTFTANVSNQAGLGNVTGKAGLSLEAGAARNSIVGNTIDGTVSISGGLSSNQDYGIRGDATAVDNVINGNTIYNHATADIEMLAGYTVTPETDQLFLPIELFTPVSGSPVMGTAGGGRREVMLFDATTQETAATWLRVPRGWASMSYQIVWVNAGAGAGNVAMRIQMLAVVDSETINATDNIGPGEVIYTAAAQDIVSTTVKSTLTGQVEGDYLSVRLSRVAATAGDTLANDIGVLGVLLTRL